MGVKGTVVAVAVGCLIVPAAASAGVLQQNGLEAFYVANPGPDTITIRPGDDNGTPAYWFDTPVTAYFPPCKQNTFSRPICPENSNEFVVLADAGNDDVSVEFAAFGAGTAPLRPTSFHGGSGNDRLSGTPLQDELLGELDDDVLILFAGPDTADGGPGADRFEQILGPALVSGGPDRDIAVFDFAATVSLDQQANDSFGASIGADVEDLDGSSFGDTFTGSPFANHLRGFAGGDTLNGADGNDELDGGAGVDQISGGNGDDTILARDGEADVINCGAGNDSVVGDWQDSLTNCEAGGLNLTVRDDDGDGSPFGVDCNDSNPGIRPGLNDIPANGVDEDCSGMDTDPDGDGVLPPTDCNDLDAAVKPGVRDRPRNGVDENCDGRDADWRVNRARIANNWLAFPGYTLVDNLRLRDIPARGRATVKCTGPGCPFKKAKRLQVRNRRANATNLFKDDRLLPGAVIQITITAPDTMGKVLRYTMRSRKLPAKRELCDPPGRQRPGRC